MGSVTKLGLLSFFVFVFFYFLHDNVTVMKCIEIQMVTKAKKIRQTSKKNLKNTINKMIYH